MILPITLTFAAIAALLNIWLATRLAPLRIGKRIAVGHGGDPLCEARMRAHANFAEYTPFVLILFGLIEFARGWPLGLWIIGALYSLGRIAHAFGMERPAPNALRIVAMIITCLSLLILAVWALLIAYRVL